LSPGPQLAQCLEIHTQPERLRVYWCGELKVNGVGHAVGVEVDRKGLCALDQSPYYLRSMRLGGGGQGWKIRICWAFVATFPSSPS
jgi:hypothetical protein